MPPWERYQQEGEPRRATPWRRYAAAERDAPPEQTQQQPQPVSQVEDVRKSFGSGVVRGVGGLIGLPGDARNLAHDASAAVARHFGAGEDLADSIGHGVAGAIGGVTMLPQEPRQLSDLVSGNTRPRRLRAAGGAEVTQALNAGIDALLPGEQQEYEPQTTAGEYAGTVGEFLPGALFPAGGARTIAGNVGRRLGVNVAAPALASETAGQVTEGTDLEGPARFVGALAGGIGADRLLTATNSANRGVNAIRQELGDAGMSREVTEAVVAHLRNGEVDAARVAIAQQLPNASMARMPTLARQIQSPDEALVSTLSEEEWMPLTAGERAGDPSAMQRESALRRAGPARAQAMLHGFEDRRAARLQDRLMRNIATRDAEPLNDSASSAGTMIADDLRAGLEAMEAAQAARYARAMKLAGQHPVAGSDELAANVARVVEENFLDAPAALSVIDRLSSQVRQGNATYATVERARQQLNRQLGAAMRSGDDAQAFAIRRIIDEVDSYVAPRLPRKARQAIDEARGYTREMLSLYGEQARPQLSTGQVGRRDLGGRRIQNIVETDIGGDAVIDTIFGASSRPPQASLAFVRRIVDRATRHTVTGGYQAPTGGAGQQVRAPGRRSLRGGKATRGGREISNTSDNLETISDPSLRSLREAFVYRLGRSLDNRQSGDGLSARTMATQLRSALGPQRELTQLMFNPEEVATMERALAHIERAVPPSGSFQPSAPGIAQDAAERSLAAITARVFRSVPFIGEPIGSAIENGVVNARALRDARAAVALPPPYASPPSLSGYREPSVLTPAVAATVSTPAVVSLLRENERAIEDYSEQELEEIAAQEPRRRRLGER